MDTETTPIDVETITRLVAADQARVTAARSRLVGTTAPQPAAPDQFTALEAAAAAAADVALRNLTQLTPHLPQHDALTLPAPLLARANSLRAFVTEDAKTMTWPQLADAFAAARLNGDDAMSYLLVRAVATRELSETEATEAADQRAYAAVQASIGQATARLRDPAFDAPRAAVASLRAEAQALADLARRRLRTLDAKRNYEIQSRSQAPWVAIGPEDENTGGLLVYHPSYAGGNPVPVPTGAEGTSQAE